jgi:hypothetical protein
MSSLKPQDDFIHPTGEEPAWREAFYFDFFDPDTRLSGFGYSGVHPNQQIGDVIFALWRDDVLLARSTRWDYNIPGDIGEERLDFGPLCFQPVTPFKTWNMFFDDGSCQLDLSFEAIHSAYSWADSEQALAETNSHHYEQQGRYRGSVRVAGERHQVNAVGVRDHAWGWGARAGIRSWHWASAQFSTDFAFNVFQVALGDGRNIHYGYVYRGEDNLFLHRSRLVAEYAQRGQAPAAFRAELETQSGERLSAGAQIINAFNISHQERNKQGYHYFCATDYLCDGRQGYGHSNFYWCNNENRPGDWTVTQKASPSTAP